MCFGSRRRAYYSQNGYGGDPAYGYHPRPVPQGNYYNDYERRKKRSRKNGVYAAMAGAAGASGA